MQQFVMDAIFIFLNHFITRSTFFFKYKIAFILFAGNAMTMLMTENTRILENISLVTGVISNKKKRIK